MEYRYPHSRYWPTLALAHPAASPGPADQFVLPMLHDRDSPFYGFNFLQSVVRTVPYGLIATDTSGRVLMANKLAVELLGLQVAPSKLKRKELHAYLDHFPSLQQKLLDALKNGNKAFGYRATPLNDYFLDIKARGLADGMLIVIGNVTSLKHTEAELLQAMMEGQETERRRLAKDLHDGIGPLLSAVKMQVEGLETAMKLGEPDALARLEQATELIDSVAEELRTVSHALMPRELLDFGLNQALLSLCNKLQRTKRVRVELIATGELSGLDSQLALALYRSTQELINNAIKHAKPTTISIQLIRHSASLVIMVEDDGCGMSDSARKAAESGIGLLNIESRVTALSGTFVLDSSPGAGTVATIEIPLID